MRSCESGKRVDMKEEEEFENNFQCIKQFTISLSLSIYLIFPMINNHLGAMSLAMGLTMSLDFVLETQKRNRRKEIHSLLWLLILLD